MQQMNLVAMVTTPSAHLHYNGNSMSNLRHSTQNLKFYSSTKVLILQRRGQKQKKILLPAEKAGLKALKPSTLSMLLIMQMYTSGE